LAGDFILYLVIIKPENKEEEKKDITYFSITVFKSGYL